MSIRETWIEISESNCIHNYERLKEVTKKEIMPVVKGNAYGHGDTMISKILEEHGAPMLCVFSYDEAIKLEKDGIKTDILIFSNVELSDIEAYHQPNFIYTISSEDWYQKIKGTNLDVRFHIEINTGMNRSGFRNRDVIEAVVSELNVEGIYTHFQSPTNMEKGKLQLEKFEEMIRILNHEFAWVHVGNAPLELVKHETWINSFRVGLGVYGYRVDVDNLKPVLSMYSNIVHKDTAYAGETIGYDHTYDVMETMSFATISIGYADNFDVRNHDVPVWIHDTFYPIVGKVCMNQTMMAVDERIQVGDTVELIGSHRTCDMISKGTGISTYAILSTLSERIERKLAK